MITPRFHLSQDAKTFTLTIRAPYCSLNELDVQIDEETFLFYCKPYYLRLKLPGQIHEERGAHSAFDSDAGEFTFTYAKVHQGETFKHLDLITQFLSPKLEVHEDAVSLTGRKIEVLSSSAPEDDDAVEAEHQYGFAQRGGYKFDVVSAEFDEIFALNPHKVPLSERKALRMQQEADAFSVDHYLADYIDGDEIDALIRQTSPWRRQLDAQRSAEPSQMLLFTAAELDFLKELPNIRHALSPRQERYAFTTLLDVLFAYCYDRRTTGYEGSCESGWNVLQLCASLRWFDAFDAPADVVVACYRRALIFPLYRRFDLCQRVLEDVKDVLRLGETAIVKILIDIYGIFLGGDAARYVLNHLFVKEYAIFVQRWDATQWSAVRDQLFGVVVEKVDLDLNLDEIERMTREESDEASASEGEINAQLERLSISAKQTETLDSDDSAGDDSDDSRSEQ